MVEKMTAVWLIILTVLVCASIPAVLIWLTTMPSSKLVLGFVEIAKMLPLLVSN